MDSVSRLLAVELVVPDVAASRRFYEQVWGLSLVQEDQGTAYLRGTGPDYYLLALREGRKPGLLRVRLGADERRSVDALAHQSAKSGYQVLVPPGAVREPGGGYGFTVSNPEGRSFSIVCEADAQAQEPATDRPVRLSHVVLNSTNNEAASQFFIDALGFRLRDRTQKAFFLGCGPDHHCIAITNRPNSDIGHVAFELADVDALFRGCGRLKKAGLELEWGVGRHGTGDNVFAYFVDPDGFAIEYTTDMQQVDDATYVPGTPETNSRSSHSDVWGVAPPPSERFLQALQGPGSVKTSSQAPQMSKDPGRKS